MAKNMTTGRTPQLLLAFAVPTILGNLFQLTYNAVDSIILERYAGPNQVAAVATANPIMNIVIFFIVGICLGTTILMSEFYGAGEMEKLKREISTSMIAGFVFTIVISVVLSLLAKPLLTILRTPKEVIPEAVTYLRIIYMGLIFTFFYNIFAAMLRSVGNSITPIYFLLLSSVLNASLDYVFIARLGMGVKGAAFATVISVGISGILCVGYAYYFVPMLRMKKEEFKIDFILLKQTVGLSLTSALQQTCLYVGKVLIQAAVNPLGVSSIVAFNAVNRVDDFAFTPQQSIAHSMTVFIAQNRGAKKFARMREGFRWGMRLEVLYGVLILTTIFFGANGIMHIFVKKSGAEAITLGVNYLRLMAFFYLLPAVTNGIQGYFRGMGDLKVTLYSTLTQMVCRIFFAYLLVGQFGLTGIAFSCLLGWIAMLLYEVPKLRKSYSKLGPIK